MLKTAPAASVRVWTIWERILITDIAPPLSSVLARMPDRRVQQFWDPRRLLSGQLKKDARPPQPDPECCDRNGHLFDVAVIYPRGVTWTDRLPTATFFNGAVVDITDQLRAAIDAR